MQMIIGGYAQGKKAYILEQLAKESLSCQVLDEHSGDLFLKEQTAIDADVIVVDHLHLLIRACEQRDTFLPRIAQLISRWEQDGRRVILIADELGNGLIPAAYEERRFREDAGRILCRLAERAEHVDRMVCGIPCRIK